MAPAMLGPAAARWGPIQIRAGRMPARRCCAFSLSILTQPHVKSPDSRSWTIGEVSLKSRAPLDVRSAIPAARTRRHKAPLR